MGKYASSIREMFQSLELKGIKCTIDYHKQLDGSRVTMWNLIPRKLMPPSRMARYCCSELKESGCANRMIATGVRWAESAKRKQREAFESISPKKDNRVKVDAEKMLLTDNDDTRLLFEQCQLKAKTVVNPIIDWKDNDIWDYYWNECKVHNLLYQMGYYRVGCIGCPMAGKSRWKEFADFPKYKQAYICAFDKMIEIRHQKKLPNKRSWKNGKEVFDWWMEDDTIQGQMRLDEFIS